MWFNVLQIFALVLDISKFEICVKYRNEINYVIHSTQCYLKYINRVFKANMQCRPLKLGGKVNRKETHLWM